MASNFTTDNLFCTCCDRPIPHRQRPGYRALLPDYWEIGPRQIVRVGTVNRALCRQCAQRIETGYERKYQRRRGLAWSVA